MVCLFFIFSGRMALSLRFFMFCFFFREETKSSKVSKISQLSVLFAIAYFTHKAPPLFLSLSLLVWVQHPSLPNFQLGGSSTEMASEGSTIVGGCSAGSLRLPGTPNREPEAAVGIQYHHQGPRCRRSLTGNTTACLGAPGGGERAFSSEVGAATRKL